MVRLRSYQREVVPQVVRGGLMEPVAGADAFGAGLGRALNETAQVMAQADTLRVEDAANQMRAKQQELAVKVQGLRGKAAFEPQQFGGQEGDDLLKTAGGWFDTAAEEVKKGLSRRQAAMFDQAAQRFRLEFTGHVQGHLGREIVTVARNTRDDLYNAEGQQLALGAIRPDGRLDGDTIAQSMARIEAGARTYAQFAGEDPAAEVLAAKSMAHGVVLAGLMKPGMNPAMAQTYFDLHKKEMDPKAILNLEGKVAAFALEGRADAAVEQTWMEAGPKTDREPASLDQLRTKLKEKLGDDPAALKLAMASLKERASERDYSIRQRESAVFGGLWKRVLAGESLKALKASPEYRDGLDGDTQAKFITEVERFRDRGGEGNNMAQFAEFWAYATNPERLAGMSDAEVFALAPRLGPALTKQLLTRKQGLGRGDAEVMEATVDADLFNHLARQNGLVVDKPSEAEKAVLGELKYRVEQTIDLEQQRLGKKLSRQEKEGIVSKLLLQVPIVSERSRMNPARWFGDKNSVEFKRLFTATAEDLQQLDASIVADEQVIYGLLNDFAEAGVLPTKERLREAYIRKMQPGKGK